MHWAEHITAGPRRVNHAAAAVGPIIYSFGGYCDGEDYSTERPMDIHTFNTLSYRWMQKPIRPTPETPFQRYGHTAVAQGSYVYIWGGRNDETDCNILYRYDTIEEKWEKPHVTGDIPRARDGHSAVIMKNKMYIFGGYEEESKQFSQDVYALDFATMTWSHVLTMGEKPECRDFHTAIVHQDRYMYVFGGRSDESGPIHTGRQLYDNRLMCFDAERQEWLSPKTTGDVPIGRRSHSAFMYEDCMYIFGGYNGVVKKHFADLHRYNTQTGEWTEMNKPFGHGPASRRRQACILLDDRVFFFGGTSPKLTIDISVQVEEEEIPTRQAEDSEILIDHDDLFILNLSVVGHDHSLL